MTIVNIVAIVVIPNTTVTMTTEKMLPLAAGYIKSGINGSQGPKTKIRKSTHGVILERTFAS